MEKDKEKLEWKRTIILSIRILRQCSALPDKEQFSEKLSLSKHFPARGLTGSVENNINVSEIIKLFFGLSGGNKVLSHWRFSLCIIQIYEIKFQQASRYGSPSRTLNQRKSDKCDRKFLLRVK